LRAKGPQGQGIGASESTTVISNNNSSPGGTAYPAISPGLFFGARLSGRSALSVCDLLKVPKSNRLPMCCAWDRRAPRISAKCGPARLGWKSWLNYCPAGCRRFRARLNFGSNRLINWVNLCRRRRAFSFRIHQSISSSAKSRGAQIESIQLMKRSRSFTRLATAWSARCDLTSALMATFYYDAQPDSLLNIFCHFPAIHCIPIFANKRMVRAAKGRFAAVANTLSYGFILPLLPELRWFGTPLPIAAAVGYSRMLLCSF